MARSRRLLKKLHRRWLDWAAADASVCSHWRGLLFASSAGASFPIDAAHDQGLDQRTRAAMATYQLRYRVMVVAGHEAQAWLSQNGSVIFKFWAVDFPSVRRFTGNNPAVI